MMYFHNFQGLMKTTAVRFFKRPIWVILVTDGSILKLNPPEELANSTDPIVVALLQWDRTDGKSGHYQSVCPKPCSGCKKIWASVKCQECSQPLCQSCNCKCQTHVDVEKRPTPPDNEDEVVENAEPGNDQCFLEVQVNK